MQKDIYDRIISFLLGASWGIILFGAYLTFKISLSLGVTLAIFLTILFIVVSLFLVLLLDGLAVNKERLEEAKKQTQLLEKIYKKHTKS
ncbi:MAG: hypothetical protein JXQ67_03035 [Campylobacterales bacterium]|nr:hypothetical protein [Campylobacterales bacterium]